MSRGNSVSISIKLPFDVDVVKLFQVALKITVNGDKFQHDETIDGGKGHWISGLHNGLLICAFYHKTKKHHVFVKSGIFDSKSNALPGHWAIASLDSTILRLSLNKTNYGWESDDEPDDESDSEPGWESDDEPGCEIISESDL